MLPAPRACTDPKRPGSVAPPVATTAAIAAAVPAIIITVFTGLLYANAHKSPKKS
jgi:hypothetical protein